MLEGLIGRHIKSNIFFDFLQCCKLTGGQVSVHREIIFQGSHQLKMTRDKEPLPHFQKLEYILYSFHDHCINDCNDTVTLDTVD
jgi:hypothetical protein